MPEPRRLAHGAARNVRYFGLVPSFFGFGLLWAMAGCPRMAGEIAGPRVNLSAAPIDSSNQFFIVTKDVIGDAIDRWPDAPCYRQQ